MRRIVLMLLILSSSVIVQDLSGQIKELKDMWINQLNDRNTDFGKTTRLKISENEFLDLLDKQPSFAMYKDNYFITGIPLDREINKHTANAKFQLSIRQRLTKTILPYNSFLVLTYTQKSFWNIYDKSSPFTDNNYNPGLALVKPVIYKDMFRGVASIALEHESNGKDSLGSRGWNYMVLSGLYFFNINFSVQAKVWAGIFDRGDPGLTGAGNSDLLNYRGYGLLDFNYRSLDDKIWISAMINPRKRIGDFNTQLEFNFKLNKKANQYLFIQWYRGYGESLLDYKKFNSMIRMGICIKPPLRNLY